MIPIYLSTFTAEDPLEVKPSVFFFAVKVHILEYSFDRMAVTPEFLDWSCELTPASIHVNHKGML